MGRSWRGFATQSIFPQPAQVPSCLDALRPDLIINPAAYTAVDKAEDEPELAMLVNADGPAALARWARTRGVPLLHFSTDYVFDGSSSRPWREDDPTGPLSVYGKSKLAGEQAIRAVGGNFLIVRTSWVYASSGANFLNTIVRLANERQELRIVADQVGAPTSSAAIADVITAITAQGVEEFRKACARTNGCLHVSASGETTSDGFATAIVGGLKSRGMKLLVERFQPIKSEEFPSRATRPRNSRLDNSRLNRALQPQTVSLAHALDRELDVIAARARASD